MFDAETDEFKVQLMAEMEEDHQRRLATYRTRPPWPRTGCHLRRKNTTSTLSGQHAKESANFSHRELQAAGHWLRAFADHVAKRLGMNVTIMLAGPIGVRWYVCIWL